MRKEIIAPQHRHTFLPRLQWKYLCNVDQTRKSETPGEDVVKGHDSSPCIGHPVLILLIAIFLSGYRVVVSVAEDIGIDLETSQALDFGQQRQGQKEKEIAWKYTMP